MIDRYDWAGGSEAMLRFGPADGPVVVAAMPLLEEWNRTRSFVVTLLRALARRGIASALPDLPGHGESLASVTDMTLPHLSAALAAAADHVAAEGRTTFGLSVRSGALVDRDARYSARWQLSPVTGAQLLGNLYRTWVVGEPSPATRRTLEEMTEPVVIAGTTLSPAFIASIASAPPTQAGRVVRLATDPRPADRKVEGVPLWRRAEPGNDLALADTIAGDIADWTKTCVA